MYLNNHSLLQAITAFAAYGHTEFLKYIETIDFAYEVTEDIRKDRLLDDIENEWFWEDIDGTQEPPNEI